MKKGLLRVRLYQARLREYEIFEMPSTVFLTPDGEVFEKVGGFMTAERINDEVNELIEASTS